MNETADPAMTDLKPCPFCGSPAEMRGDVKIWHWITCTAKGCDGSLGYSCQCENGEGGIYATPEEAAAAWNKRAI